MSDSPDKSEKMLSKDTDLKPKNVSRGQASSSPFGFSISETALTGILVILIFFVLDYASVIIMPIILAIMLSLLFTPIIQFLTLLHIPQRLGAALIVLSLTSMILGGILILSEPAGRWLDKAPQYLKKIDGKLQKIKKPIEQVQQAADKVEDMAAIDDGKEPNRLTVKLEPTKLSETVFVATPKVLAFLVLLMVLLYFLLFSGEDLAKYIVHSISRLARQQCPLDMGYFIQREISRYLFTIATINVVLGMVVAAVFQIIGMPNPILWGTMVAAFNFAPYIGALSSLVVIAVVAFASFEEISHVLLAPSLFLLITTLEGQVITPIILGRQFSLNPLLVFLSMIVWGWMWGYIGALLAVPLLVSIKIICQSVDTLQPVAKFMGGDKESISI